MAITVRHQIFVSSTFTDLKEERAEVLQAVWELDCIPTGMEAFLATNEAQWDVIRKVIDECDYYVLIVGGRYGSVTDDGISYTEKEYNYAKSIGIPILGFVHGNPENIVVSKTELDERGRTHLEAFRTRVMAEHPIRRWTNSQELGGLVSRSISREVRINPRPGWVRNTGLSNTYLIEQVNDLLKENSTLKEKLIEKDDFTSGNVHFEGGSSVISLTGRIVIYPKGARSYESSVVEWRADASWDDIFKDVGPILLNEANEEQIKEVLCRFVSWSTVDFASNNVNENVISPYTYAEVIVQLRALGYIEKGIRRRAVGDRDNYWVITDKGERHLVNLLARKRQLEGEGVHKHVPENN